MLAVAVATGELRNDCRICTRVPEARAAWGCDAPVTPFLSIDCPACLGFDPKCERCKGDPRGILIDRCPFSTMSPGIAAIIPYYADWQQGRMPVEGGVLDQSAAFVEAMRFLDSAVARLKKGPKGG